MGHTQDDQGFQLFSWYWIGHAHNIYLQYATDFGILMCICFIVFCISCIFSLIKNYLLSSEIRSVGYLLFLLVPLLFGMLEFSWGSGSVTVILLFFCWREGIYLQQNRK